MTIKLSSILVDVEREVKGDWVPSEKWPGVEYHVSSLNLPEFTVALQLMYQRLARTYRGKPVPLDVRAVETGKLLHKHILHDWRGFDEPYSRDRAKEIFTGPQGRDFAADVEASAAKISERDVEYVEDQEKNSEAPSAGN